MSQDYLPTDFALPTPEEIRPETSVRQDPRARRESDSWFELVDQARCPLCHWPLVPRILCRRVFYWCACPEFRRAG